VQSIKPDRSLAEHLASLDDTRWPLKRQVILHDMTASAIPAILYDARGWVANAEFGRSKRRWFNRSVMLPDVIPSQNTSSDEVVEVEDAIIDADAKDYFGLPAAIDATGQGYLRRNRRHYRAPGPFDGLSVSAAPERLNMLDHAEPTAAVTARPPARRATRSAVPASPTSVLPPAGMIPIWTSSYSNCLKY
jgi:hypothetical protein